MPGAEDSYVVPEQEAEREESSSEAALEPEESRSEATSEPKELCSEAALEPEESCSEAASEPKESCSEAASEPKESCSEAASEPEESCSEAPTKRRKVMTKRSRSSRSSRAGLLFSVSRVERHLRRGQFAQRFGSKAPVFLAAVLQSVTHKTMEMAGKVTKKCNQKRISLSHLQTVVEKSSVLRKVLEDSLPRRSRRTVLQSKRLAPLSRKKTSKSGKRSSRRRAARAPPQLLSSEKKAEALASDHQDEARTVAYDPGQVHLDAPMVQ